MFKALIEHLRNVSPLQLLDALLVYLFLEVLSRTLKILSNRDRKFFIHGFWVTDFVSENKHVVEIYHFKPTPVLFSKNNVRIVAVKLQHYKEGGPTPVIFAKGMGYVQDRNLVLTYYTTQLGMQRVGGMLFRARDSSSGTFWVGDFRA